MIFMSYSFKKYFFSLLVDIQMNKSYMKKILIKLI